MRTWISVVGAGLLTAVAGCSGGASGSTGCDQLAATLLAEERTRELRTATMTERHRLNGDTGSCLVAITSEWALDDGSKGRDTRVLDAKWRNVLVSRSERAEVGAFSCVSNGQTLEREACDKRIGELVGAGNN